MNKRGGDETLSVLKMDMTHKKSRHPETGKFVCLSVLCYARVHELCR